MSNETPNTQNVQNQPSVQKQGEQQQKQSGQQTDTGTAGTSEKKSETAGSDANKDTTKR